MPKIGYGSNKKTKFLAPNGFKTILIHNKQDLEMLMMQNDTYQAQVAHNVSSRKRIEIVTRAKQLDIKLQNPYARIRSTEV
jgi:large subunit ribosomal protein L32e